MVFFVFGLILYPAEIIMCEMFIAVAFSLSHHLHPAAICPVRFQDFNNSAAAAALTGGHHIHDESL